MHEHPNVVAIFLTDGHTKFTLPDGKTINAPIKAGTTQELSGSTLISQPQVREATFQTAI
ncbi:MAG: hypothetical protein IPP88_06540 [Betaproteobacteria bacterium]|nr:hypothetical protein [Betaproteobacteria bacterium]